MNYKRFLEITREKWNTYFKWLQDIHSKGYTNLKENLDIFFPTILLITETKDFYVAEFLGASREFQGLTIKTHTENSINRYLYQFNLTTTEPGMKIGSFFQFDGVGIMRRADMSQVMLRFPFVNPERINLSFTGAGEGSVIQITKESGITHFTHCLFINTYRNLNRVKDVLLMDTVAKNVSALEYGTWLETLLTENGHHLLGVHICTPEEGFALALGGQFANTYLIHHLRETTIGEFLNAHRDIIERAVGTKKFIYEPELLWIESNPSNTDKAINPDLLIERDDGFYDIYDLKLPLLDKKSLTKGERKRRRFIDGVNEGIAQLANYSEYFTFEKNCEYAFNKYGIKTNKPNLVLVVGNYENANRDEIEEASRSQRQNISIVDYDSLLQLFLLSYKSTNNIEPSTASSSL